MVHFYLVKATESQIQLIQEICEYLDIKQYEIYQLKLGITPQQIQGIVICFGDPAYNLVSKECPTAIKLPSIEKLVKKPGNESSRESAWAILNSVFINKTINPSTFTLSNQDILEFDLAKLAKNNWVGTTEDGKKIIISNGPVNAQYQITFNELVIAKAAFDLLGLKTLSIGKTDNVKEQSSD